MPIFLLNEDLVFPDTAQAEPDGMLAIGGDLSPERLLLAYQNGIFPWFNEDDPIMWWSPSPRFVLKPNEVKVSKSMRPLLNKGAFEFTVNKDFEGVIENCKNTNRNNQEGTWITNEMKKAYLQLHHLGWAHSFESWKNGVLFGGLYGIAIGKSFFGESMFSKKSNASKYAFIKCCQLLEKEGFNIIDCQIHSEHLESLGAYDMSRTTFERIINETPPFTKSSLINLSCKT